MQEIVEQLAALKSRGSEVPSQSQDIAQRLNLIAEQLHQFTDQTPSLNTRFQAQRAAPSA
jgi:hypothetical protein